MEIIVTIKVVDMNHHTHTIEMSNATTGYQLKTYIYSHLCQSLTQHQMDLSYEGAVIANNQRLSEFNIAVGTCITFKQQKIDLNKVASIIAVNEDDPISGQNTFVTKMICGHSVARDTMIALIRSLLTEKKYEIRCPNVDENAAKCLMEWEFKQCRKIGVFTKEETLEFEEGLSHNWLKSFGKECPTCKIFICKGDLKTNRVKCPGCKSPDFCYICLQPWKGGSGNFCGSSTCQFYNQYLANSPWERIFRVKDKNNGNVVIDVKTPKLRMCPNCSITIENYISCKHTECKGCNKKFCWICLQVLNGSWTCGSYEDYCGKVAQVQKLK